MIEVGQFFEHPRQHGVDRLLPVIGQYLQRADLVLRQAHGELARPQRGREDQGGIPPERLFDDRQWPLLERVRNQFAQFKIVDANTNAYGRMYGTQTGAQAANAVGNESRTLEAFSSLSIEVLLEYLDEGWGFTTGPSALGAQIAIPS